MAATRVYLGIGSNVGDRASTIKRACELLSSPLEQLEQASLYETLPRDVTDQPRFLNTVLSGSTKLRPADLLECLLEIEGQLGRNRVAERLKGPRTVDIDLLLYGAEVIETDDLIIPHPRMTERKFVLVPLLEIAPLATHPATGVAFQSYLEALPPQGIYYFQSSGYSRGISGHR